MVATPIPLPPASSATKLRLSAKVCIRHPPDALVYRKKSIKYIPNFMLDKCLSSTKHRDYFEQRLQIAIQQGGANSDSKQLEHRRALGTVGQATHFSRLQEVTGTAKQRFSHQTSDEHLQT